MRILYLGAGMPLTSEAPDSHLNASDPEATFINASCLDLLLIEMVPMAYRLTTEVGSLGYEEGAQAEDENTREAAFHRLEALGYRVGQGLVER